MLVGANFSAIGATVSLYQNHNWSKLILYGNYTKLIVRLGWRIEEIQLGAISFIIYSGMVRYLWHST